MSEAVGGEERGDDDVVGGHVVEVERPGVELGVEGGEPSAQLVDHDRAGEALDFAEVGPGAAVVELAQGEGDGLVGGGGDVGVEAGVGGLGGGGARHVNRLAVDVPACQLNEGRYPPDTANGGTPPTDTATE